MQFQFLRFLLPTILLISTSSPAVEFGLYPTIKSVSGKLPAPGVLGYMKMFRQLELNVGFSYLLAFGGADTAVKFFFDDNRRWDPQIAIHRGTDFTLVGGEDYWGFTIGVQHGSIIVDAGPTYITDSSSGIPEQSKSWMLMIGYNSR